MFLLKNNIQYFLIYLNRFSSGSQFDSIISASFANTFYDWFEANTCKLIGYFETIFNEEGIKIVLRLNHFSLKSFSLKPQYPLSDLLVRFEYGNILAVWFAWHMHLVGSFEFALSTTHEPSDPVFTLCSKHSRPKGDWHVYLCET